jgi:hypothetical protein
VCLCPFLSRQILNISLAGDAVVINPEISSGLPIASINRRPQPASRPEKYSTPATKGTIHQLVFHCLLMDVSASDPAQNPYWKRDVRRAYPQLSVITQSELSSLLIEHSGTQTYVCCSGQDLCPLSHNVILQDFFTF